MLPLDVVRVGEVGERDTDAGLTRHDVMPPPRCGTKSDSPGSMSRWIWWASRNLGYLSRSGASGSTSL